MLKKGMGIGGWLTNYKRFNVLPEEWRRPITIGDMEHFAEYITEWDIENIKNMGLDHIRIGFDQIVLQDQNGSFRKEILEKLEDTVKWCQKRELDIIFNLHKAIGNYCDIKEDVTLFQSEVLQKGFVDFWAELEKYFGNYPNVMFELLNEVRDIEPSLWNDLYKSTVAAIREQNKERIIIVGSTCWNSPDTLCDLEVLEDKNVYYTFHTYAPFEFTHQRGVLQMQTLYYNRKMTYPSQDIERYRDYHRLVYNNNNAYESFNKIDIDFIRYSLRGAVEFKKKYPDKILWCGEFGTIRHADITSRENWMQDVISVLKENDIPYCVWNYLSTPNDGNRFSLVDDDTRKILSEGMLKIIRGEF